jgi:hypothetical protein
MDAVQGERLTSLENTPRDTGDQVVNQQMFDLLGGDGYRNHAGEHSERSENNLLVAESFSDETVQSETEDFTTVGGL